MKVAAALVASVSTLLLGGHSTSHVQVVAREFSYSLSRVQLRSGASVVELVNMGQDAHDLRVQRIGARHVAGTQVVSAGGRAELNLRLAPGRYRFWCSVADHQARGMRATLIVAR